MRGRDELTQLLGNECVKKTHPRIVLRGKLDTLQAQMLMAQVECIRAGEAGAAASLEELLGYTRSVMAAEVLGRETPELRMAGMDGEAIHEASHHPERLCPSGHLNVTAAMGGAMAAVNLCRAVAREAELAAVAAFDPEREGARPDILRGMNRLSSALYVLMLQLAAGG